MSKENIDESKETVDPIHGDIEKSKIESLKRLEKTVGWGQVLTDKVFEFANIIQTQYPDYNKYRAYHQLIGSTPPDGVIEGDFEGKFSVKAFFESLGRVG